MDPNVLEAVIYAIGLVTVAGIYVKGKIFFSNWLDDRLSFWKAALVYNGVTVASLGTIIMLAN